MTIDARHAPRARRAAVAAIRRGHLTMAEVADLAGTSRQLVAYWCAQAKVDARRARERYIAAEWTDALRAYGNE